MPPNDEDRFQSSLATLKRLVGSPERPAAASSSADSASQLLQAEVPKRQAILQQIHASLAEREDYEKQTDAANRQWQAACQKEQELEAAHHAAKDRHAQALETLDAEREEWQKRAQETEQTELGAVEAEAARLELQCQELDQQMPRREEALQRARATHQAEQSLQQATVKSLLENLKQARANLKAVMEQRVQQEKKATEQEPDTADTPVLDDNDMPPAADDEDDFMSPPENEDDTSPPTIDHPTTEKTSPTAPKSVAVSAPAPVYHGVAWYHQFSRSAPIVHPPPEAKRGVESPKPILTRKLETPQESSSSSSSPPTKKVKVDGDWMAHSMNMQDAIADSYKGKFLSEVVDAPLSALQGVTDDAMAAFASLHLHTVRDLGEYKFFKIAQGIQILSKTEGTRLPGTQMNLDNALDHEHETKSLQEILTLPVSALQGLSTKAEDAMETLGIGTIADLATFKYATLAEAIVELAPFEETKTKKERKKERMLHKLE